MIEPTQEISILAKVEEHGLHLYICEEDDAKALIAAHAGYAYRFLPAGDLKDNFSRAAFYRKKDAAKYKNMAPDDLYKEYYDKALAPAIGEKPLDPTLATKVEKFALDKAKFELISYLISYKHIGNQKTALAMFFQILNAKSRQPVNIAIKGDSSVGKTNLTNTILGLFPTSWIQKVGRLTANAIFYLPDIDAPILYLQELKLEGNEAYGLKLSSADDGGFSIGYTARDAKSGEMTTKIKKINARMFIATTTSIAIDPELETRTTEYNLVDDEKQTEDVLMMKATNEEMPKAYGDIFADSELRKVIQAYIDSLPADAIVKIPYAKKIAALLPARDPRMRRDIDKLFAIIKGISLFDYRNRLHGKDADGKLVVIAAAHDYELAFDLFANAFKETLSGIDGRGYKILEVMAHMDPGSATAPKITSKVPGIKSSNTTRDLLKHMIDLGYVAIDEDGSRPNKIVYELTAYSPDSTIFKGVEYDKIGDLSSVIVQLIPSMFRYSTKVGEELKRIEEALKEQLMICQGYPGCISEYDSTLSSIKPYSIDVSQSDKKDASDDK